MSVLELKGEVHDMIAQVHDKELLQKIKSFISSLASEDKAYPDGLSRQQYEVLLSTANKSKSEKELVDVETAHKLFDKWKER